MCIECEVQNIVDGDFEIDSLAGVDFGLNVVVDFVHDLDFRIDVELQFDIELDVSIHLMLADAVSDKSQIVMCIFSLEFNFWKPLKLRLEFRWGGLWILRLILEWIVRLRLGFNLWPVLRFGLMFC